MDSLESDILIEGLSDWVTLGQVGWFVSQRHPEVASGEASQKGLTAIGSLLESGLIQVGNVASDKGFSAWDLPIDGILDRVQSLWAALDSDPYVCWLSNTECGDSIALELFEPVGRVRGGILCVWLTAGHATQSLDFGCVLDITEEGGIVGAEIGHFHQQLGDVTAAQVRSGSTIHWSHDAEHDTFYLHIEPKRASVRKEASGVARLDDQRRVVRLEIVL